MSAETDVTFDDSKWQRLKRLVSDMNKRHVKVGVLDASEETESGFSLVDLAAVHEYGSKDGAIPQRSFIRSTLMSTSRNQLGKLTEELYGKVIHGKKSIDRALNELGLWAATQIKRRIARSEITPPLAVATIKRKGSSVPLVDTGQLINGITWQVEE